MTLSQICNLLSAHYGAKSPVGTVATQALASVGDMGQWDDDFPLPTTPGAMLYGLHWVIGQALRGFAARLADRPRQRRDRDPKMFALGTLRSALDDLATKEHGPTSLYFGDP